jgi:bacteriocin resistance YdeI/OmpD-like protein/uncharacterized protein DUF1905
MEHMPARSFEGVLGSGSMPVIEVPARLVEAFGAGKRPPVQATVDGYTFRTTIAVYGGRYYIGLRKDVRAAAGVEPGQRVKVNLELDTQPREVEIPSDLASALAADPKANAAFERLSFTHRKEYVQAIALAKKEETRRRRLEKTIQALRDKSN